jgi:hypothetical protein
MHLLKPNIKNYLTSFIASGRKFNDLHTYCMFVGYQRSGHSLIGALLDAHPDMIIAHELNVLNFLKKGYSRKQIFHLLLQQSKAFYQDGSQWMGYSYRVEGQWQGRYRDLKVIGDKRGGSSIKILQDNPELLDKVSSFCSKLRLIHVIRNPYDNIATMVMRKEQKLNRVFTEEDYLRKIDHYFDKSNEINEIKKLNKNLIDIYIEDFVKDPVGHLVEICAFLGVESNEEYIESCAKIVFKQNSKSRHKINKWTPEIIENIKNKINEFEFLQKYSFEC